MTKSPDLAGDRSISITGNVNSSVLITGDYNVVHQYNSRLLAPIPVPAPPLPKYFVPRPEITNDLKTRLWGKQTTDVALVVSAIHGLGGIGKSTLVAALAHDDEVQEHFPDGVFWATLGQQPDMLSLLSSWVHALGDRDFRPTTVTAASEYLRSLLQDKAALLVIDDAWDPSHTTPFLIGGVKCRMLITTRDAMIATVVGANLYDLDVMTAEQALALLIGRLGHDLSGEKRTQALELAEIVGYLPLALELAAAQATEGVSWPELLLDLKSETAQLERLGLLGADEIKEDQERKRYSLLASFNLSLRRLKAGEYKRFAWLGVVPEDVTLSPTMMTVLWEIETRAAQETLRYLRDKALLLPAIPLADGTPTYRMHDLLHDLARRILTAPREPTNIGELPGLNIAISMAHMTFLNRYRLRSQANQWHTLTDDGYIFSYLTWHLEQSGQSNELYALLREETPARRNGWYQAREQMGQTAGYLADVARAWRVAEEQCVDSPSPKTIKNFFCCAFLTASLNSLAKNIPPDLLAALVKKGVWIPAQGLAYARQVPTAEQRARTLRIIAPHLPALLQDVAVQEAFTAMCAVDEDDDLTTAVEKALGRAQELLALAPYLSAPLQAEAQTFVRLAITLDSALARAEALIGLLPYLPTPLKANVLQEAVTALQTVIKEAGQSATLVRLISELAGHGYPSDAVTVARTIQSYSEQIAILLRIIHHLSVTLREQILQEALIIASAFQSPRDRVEMLMQIVPHLPASLQEQTLQEVIAIAHTMESTNYRLTTLIQASLYLPVSTQTDLLSKALVNVGSVRANTPLAAMLPQLADLGYPSEALTIARGILFSHDRVEALARLIPHLSESMQEEILQELLVIVRTVYPLENRTQLLVTTILRLPKLVNEETLREALVGLHSVEPTYVRAHLLARLAPSLPEPLLQEALAVVHGIKRATDRADTLAHLAPYLSKALLQESLTLVRLIGDEEQHVAALLALVRRLPLLDKAWSVVGWGVQDEVQRMAREIARGAWTTISNSIIATLRMLLMAIGLLLRVGGLILVVGGSLALLVTEIYTGSLIFRFILQLILRLATELPILLFQLIIAFPKLVVLIGGGLITIFAAFFDELRAWVIQSWIKVRENVHLAKHAGRNLLQPLKPKMPKMDKSRTRVVSVIAPFIASSEKDVLRQRSYWSGLHQALAYRTRQDLLLDMHVLSHMFVFIGGKQVLQEIASIIQDVEQWWP